MAKTSVISNKSPQRWATGSSEMNTTLRNKQKFRRLKRRCRKAMPSLLTAGAVLALAACATNPHNPVAEITRHIVSQDRHLSAQALPAGSSALRNNQVLVFQPTAMPGPRLVKVRTSPVRVNRNFSGNPYNPAHVAVGKSIPLHAPDRLSRWVLVSGNYTPKGVYIRPDSSSRILTRIAPGARLRLEKTVGGWHKVETEQGTGYLRGHDAKLLATTQPGVKARVIKPAS